MKSKQPNLQKIKLARKENFDSYFCWFCFDQNFP